MEPKTMPASWSQATEALGWTSQKANVLCTFSTLLLCAWTHPHYYRIRLASLFRIPLTVITVLWWSHCLFNRNPAAEGATGNLGHLLGCYLLITKSLDWGFFSGPQDIRGYVVENQVGEWRWESTRGKSKAEHGLLGFILHQVISLRGLQFRWGHTSRINRRNIMDDVGRLLLCHVASLASLAIALSVQKLHTGSFGQGWKMSYILSFVAQNLEVVLAMTGICTAMEAANSALAVCAHVLHALFCLLGLPYTFCEVVNPIYYPPLFANLLETKSLSDFWGTTWQQTLRRSFIVSGAFPLGGLARALGMTTKIQKHVGFLGVFVVSGLLHAYALGNLLSPLGEAGKVQLRVSLCFLLQAIGIWVEPFIIPLIPKRLGGGRLWTAIFLSITLRLAVAHSFAQGGLLSKYKPLEQWDFRYIMKPLFYLALRRD